MKTVFDWACVVVFAALAVLFLHRSSTPTQTRDKIWHYAPPAFGCALVDFLGNGAIDQQSQPQEIVSFVLLLAVILYIVVFLKPFDK